MAMLGIFRFPKNDKEYYWTSHSKSKMLQYRISEQKIKTILKNPFRIETGVAPKTVAVMKRNDTPKRKEEVWVMYQTRTGSENIKSDKRNGAGRKAIISAWRYPGVSKKHDIPIPEDVLSELENFKS